MVKMENPNRKGQVKKFNDTDVEQAKADGWSEINAKPKVKKSKKTWGGK